MEKNTQESAQKDYAFSGTSIDAMISSLSLRPVAPSWSHDGAPGPTGLSLLVVPEMMKKIKEASGVPQERLSDTFRHSVFPQLRVELDEQALDSLERSSVIYGLERPLSKNYYLHLLEDGRISVSYQSISGGRAMGALTPAQMTNLEAKAAELIAERDLKYAPVYSAYQAERAEKEAKALGVESAAVGKKTPASAAARAQKAKSVASPSPAVGAAPAIGKDLASQLNALSTDGQDIRLPEAQLSQYKVIRQILLDAGGEYSTDKQGSFFRFTPDVDLDELMTKIKAGERPKLQQETQFFATSPGVVRVAADTIATDFSGLRFLEPSAGDGAMAKELIKRGADVVCVENWTPNVTKLQTLKAANDASMEVLDKDFLSVSHQDLAPFDGILMNPPFTKGADMAHVRHALGFLKPDGELTSIMSPAFVNGSTKGPTSFRQMVELADGVVHNIPAGAFKASGTDVATVIVHIKMEHLLSALEARGEDGAEYGIDLSSVRSQAKVASVRP